MKFFTLSVLICCLSGFAKGDVLRLRNGTEFVGHYIGGTTTEIWFQRDGMVSTTEVIPTSLVEALKFEPGAVNPASAQVRSKAPAHCHLRPHRPSPPPHRPSPPPHRRAR